MVENALPDAMGQEMDIAHGKRGKSGKRDKSLLYYHYYDTIMIVLKGGRHASNQTSFRFEKQNTGD